MTVMKVVKSVEVPDLGAAIKKAREAYCKEKGIIVAQFAVELGMTPQNLYRIEGEKQQLDDSVLRKLEALLGVDFGVEFGGKADD